MDKIKITNRMLLGGIFAAAALCGGCSQDLTDGAPQPSGEGVILRLDTGSRAPASGDGLESESTLNEDKIDHLDIFFCRDGEIKHYEQIRHEAIGKASEDGTLSVKLGFGGSYWKTVLNRPPYNVYVLANVHAYDNPETEETETDFAWIKAKGSTAAEYLRNSLTDADPDIFRAEGEKSATESAPYAGKLFQMSGEQPQWNPNGQPVVDIPMTLKRSAAKIRIQVSYTADFIKDDISIDRQQLRKALVNYTAEGPAVTGYGTPSAVLCGEAKIEGNPDASLANEDTGTAVDRRQTLTLYSYATPDWSANPEQETYVLMDIPYTQNGQTKSNYYKVPVIPAGGGASGAARKLESNKLYTVRVTVDRVGSPSILEPVTLTPDISLVEDWKTFDIGVDGTRPQYLQLEASRVLMDGEETKDIRYIASGQIKTEFWEYYYIDKTGKWIYILKDGTLQSGYGDFPLNKAEGCTFPTGGAPAGAFRVFSKKSMSGKYAKINRSSRHIKVRVTFKDAAATRSGGAYERMLEIVQYPNQMYASINGVMAYMDADNISYANYKGWGPDANYTPTYLANKWYEKPAFPAKCVTATSTTGQECQMHNIECRTDTRSGSYYLTPKSAQISQNNNSRMYIFRTASTSDNYIIGHPQMDEGGNVKADEETTRTMLSPAFILASQLGQTTTKSWTQAQKHCHDYVEVYDPTFNHNPRTITFKDWRLPTHAELQQMIYAQQNYKDVMEQILTGSFYWNSMKQEVTSTSTSTSTSKPSYENYYVRCVHDLTPDIMEQLEELNAF